MTTALSTWGLKAHGMKMAHTVGKTAVGFFIMLEKRRSVTIFKK